MIIEGKKFGWKGLRLDEMILIDYSRTTLFLKWTKELELNFSAETCQRLAAAFQENFSSSDSSPIMASKQQRIVDFNLTLHKLLNDTNLRLHEASVQLLRIDSNQDASQLMVNLLKDPFPI